MKTLSNDCSSFVWLGPPAQSERNLTPAAPLLCFLPPPLPAAVQGDPQPGWCAFPDDRPSAAHHAGRAVQHYRPALPVCHAAGALHLYHSCFFNTLLYNESGQRFQFATQQVRQNMCSPHLTSSLACLWLGEQSPPCFLHRACIFLVVSVQASTQYSVPLLPVPQPPPAASGEAAAPAPSAGKGALGWCGEGQVNGSQYCFEQSWYKPTTSMPPPVLCCLLPTTQLHIQLRAPELATLAETQPPGGCLGPCATTAGACCSRSRGQQLRAASAAAARTAWWAAQQPAWCAATACSRPCKATHTQVRSMSGVAVG